jgi:hypothetical protein
MNWSSGGEDWRDAGLDARLATEWLRNERLWGDGRPHCEGIPAGYDLDLDARVSELVQTDLDPERGWRLLLTLLRLAEDERDIAAVALGPLETFVRNHGDTMYQHIDRLAKPHTRLLAALERTTGGWPGRHRPKPVSRITGEPDEIHHRDHD